MTAPTGETTPAAPTTTAPTAVPETAPQTPSAATEPATAPATGKAPVIDGPFDAERATSLIEKLRGEVGELKQGKTAAEKAAADEMAAFKKQFADQNTAIAKALGIVIDDDTPKPEQIAAQAVAEAQSVQGQLRALQLQLAVDKASTAHGADAGALNDSLTFQNAVTGLDPKAPDYAAQVAAAVQAAITANPRLKTTPAEPVTPPASPVPEVPKPAAGVSGAEITAGTQSGAITEKQLEGMTNEEINKALEEGRLAHLL